MTHHFASEASSLPLRMEHGKIARCPHYVRVGLHSLAAWLHLPRDGHVSGTVLILPPFGFEYTHSHRSLLYLADRLAENGLAALRIDYPGAGDSSGDETTVDAPREWIDGAVASLQLLADAVPDARPSIIGVRLGALIGAVVAEKIAIGPMVAWAPVSSGRRAMREARALHLVSADEGDESGYLEPGGFRISDSAVASLSELDIVDLTPRVSECLIVNPSTLPSDWAWRDRMRALDVQTDELDQEDFAEMMAEPQFTKIPKDTLTGVTAWLSKRASTTSTAFDEDFFAKRASDQTGPEDRSWTERHVLIRAEDRDLVGVFTEPALSQPADRVVVLTNSGSVHHVGPNRLYVELSRRLAAEGIPALRFDLRNLGDSLIPEDPDENHPYPQSATADVAACVAWVRARFPNANVSLVGLCSGAHTAFRATAELDDRAVDNAICLNPLTFRYVPGMSLETPAQYQTARDATYYRQAVRDPARWKRLFAGQSNVLEIAGFVWRRVAERSFDAVRLLRRILAPRPNTALEDDIQAAMENQRTLDFLFSSTDPGPEILYREAGPLLRRPAHRRRISIEVVQGADHTFSRWPSRREVIERVLGVLVRRTTLDLESISLTPSVWDEIRPAWTSLFGEIRESSAFLSPPWIERWLAQPAKEREGTVLIWRNRHQEIVGMCVLSQHVERFGKVSIRRSFLNTSGPGSPGCEHNDVLVSPPYRRAVYESLAHYVKTQVDSDELALIGTRVPLTSQLRRAWGSGTWEGFRSESPYVDLEAVRQSGKPYLNYLSSNTRSQVRRSIRLYEETFGDRFVRSPSAREEALATYDQMLELHDARWSSDGRCSGFSDEARSFHRELIHDYWGKLEDHRDLQVDLLSLGFGDEVIGVIYSLVCRGHVHFYQSGLAYHEDRRLKPGLVSHTLAIEHYLLRGRREYDFLGGEAEPVQYKRSLSTNIHHLAWGQISLGTTRVHALRAARTVKRRASALLK